jgi:hypothetical protein
MPWKLDVAPEFFRWWHEFPFVVQEVILDHLEDFAQRPLEYSQPVPPGEANPWEGSVHAIRHDDKLWEIAIRVRFDHVEQCVYVSNMLILQKPL